ncbi:tyrosine-protein kinase FRK-like [Penaeus vannamei]|uniref:tyrosine-protein kinase FRK-like n=1 Tax=Penaeus vannamei TaxID=6689 RepID=UPI00387F905A
MVVELSEVPVETVAEEVVAAEAGDSSELAGLYGIHPVGGRRSTATGVPLVRLASLVHPEMTKLGEGAYASVYDVSRPGLPPVCLKWFKDEDGQDHLKEAEMLHALRKVPGLPKLVGLSRSPAAVAMTCHGTLDLQAWASRRFDLDEYLKMLLALSTTLRGLHAEGFTHNDLKADNVMVGERNVPTLIDVGLVSPINSCPFWYNDMRNARDVESERASRSSHLAPEIYRGGRADPSADVYSFGKVL